MLKSAFLLVPLAIIIDLTAPQQPTLIFFASGLAIVPLAAAIGRATGELSHYTGAGVSGLLLATFGNTAEMILTVTALIEGLHAVVKAAIVGCIIGNVLLVLGTSMLAGGLKHRTQRFDTVAAGSQASLLMLAVFALFGLASFRELVGPLDGGRDASLSLAVAVVLLVAYGCSLIYVLITHRSHFSGDDGDAQPDGGGAPEAAPWSLRRTLLVLIAATAVLAWVSDILIESLSPMTADLGLAPVFVSIFVIAIFGVVAEYVTALRAALRNRIDLSLSVAMGASAQIALFVAPTLVLLSHVIGPQPMDLKFHPGQILAVFLAVMIMARLASDGRSDWLKGAQLLALYVIFAILFFFVPALPADALAPALTAGGGALR